MMLTEEQERIFCENIVYLRKLHGLTIGEMAKKLCVSKGALERLEGGKINPNIAPTVSVRLFEEFGIVPAKQFVSFDENKGA